MLKMPGVEEQSDSVEWPQIHAGGTSCRLLNIPDSPARCKAGGTGDKLEPTIEKIGELSGKSAYKLDGGWFMEAVRTNQ